MDNSPDKKTKNVKKAPTSKTGTTKKKAAPVRKKSKASTQRKEEFQEPNGINREEIESRLNKILESDPENGREKVSLFAGRCALRVFPLVIETTSQIKADEGRILPIDYISKNWRALMSGWLYKLDAHSFAYAATAAQAVSDADTYAAYATFAAAAASSGTSSTAGAASYVAKYFTDYTGSEAFVILLDDLSRLESSSLSSTQLRRMPLWGYKGMPQVISDMNWSTSIDRLIAITDGEADKNLLQKIKIDYQAILDGVWRDDVNDTDPETQTRDTAPEQPEEDDPSADDFLGRDKLVNALLPRLSVEDDANHLTIGLLGNWGVGKSSVIEQMKQKLDKVWHTEYIYGEFNAWRYEKTPNLQAGITHEVISALTTARPEWPWNQRLFYKPLVTAEFAARLHGARIIGIFFLLAVFVVTSIFSIEGELAGSAQIGGLLQGVVGIGSIASLIAIWQLLKTVSAQPLAKELKTYLRLPSYQEHLGKIPVMDKQIKTLCEICLNGLWSHKQRRLIFFIDDLDRCGVDGIIQTFEAVRLVLGIRWVTVVIAMDQRIALPALACHYKQLSEFHQNDPMSIARDYLGKVIHLPVSLPPPDDLGVAQYLAYIWHDPEFFERRKPVEQPDDNQRDNDESATSRKQHQAVKNEDDMPEETLQDVIDDINKMDVRAALKPEDVTPTGDENIETIQQLSGPQKEAFFDWLLKLNLRNPRQIKRLYNSYNLLWSHYGDDWPADEHGHPYMVALFVLEMINENVIHSETEDTKALLRESFFSERQIITMPEIEEVGFKILSEARKVIVDYQNSTEVKLLARIEPFVLPASSPQHSSSE